MTTAPKKKAKVKKATKKKVSRKKKDILGHDPLAWISDEDADQLKNNIKEDKAVVGEIKETEPDAIDTVVDEIQEEEIMSEQTIFELPSYFGIAQVATTYGAMQNFLKNSTEVIEIEAKDVESIDTAALQLLAVFINEAKTKDKTIKWNSCSDKLSNSIELLGMSEDLGVS